MSKREMLSEESLDKVSGGSLEYVWDASTQIGYVYSKDLSQKYYFNRDNYDNVVRAVFNSDGNGKTDSEDISDMAANNWFFKVE